MPLHIYTNTKPLIKVNLTPFNLTVFPPCTTTPLSITLPRARITSLNFEDVVAAHKSVPGFHSTQSARHKDHNTYSPHLSLLLTLFHFLFSFSLISFLPSLSLNLFHPLTLWAGATVISHYLTIKSQELIKWPRSGTQSTFPLGPAP